MGYESPPAALAAMSPRERRLALLSFLGVICVALYYIPAFLYVTSILAGCCSVCYYHSRKPLPARSGPNPRAGVNLPVVLRRWLDGLWLAGRSVAARERSKTSIGRAELRETQGHFRRRQGEVGIYREQAPASDSFLFSPRDFLMGSYVGKPLSPKSDPWRPGLARNPREQLRENLSRPNHAVCTPVRKLSFTGEQQGTMGRFTITPLRHYPLQQPGVSSVGVLPPVKWDGFRKKNILSPHNSPAVHSPVIAKTAQPQHSTPSSDHLNCTVLPSAPTDPCSRETVLQALNSSRKRRAMRKDGVVLPEENTKRRRNDSGGSSQSAFEPFLPNGTTSQLVPKPGSLKRSMTQMAEESVTKRSRTSSISSGSGVQVPRQTPGTNRNAIHSSYSSSVGLSQRKKPSTPSSHLSSPGSSRSQTPEEAAKRPRQDNGQSSIVASSERSDQTTLDKAPITPKATPVCKAPITTSADSTGSGGKRKRKIPLLPTRWENNQHLPLPPGPGFSITLKELDEERRDSYKSLQKFLKTLEPDKPASPPAPTSTQPTSTTSSATTMTLSSLLAAPLPTPSSSTIPVINLDPSPSNSISTAPVASSSLVEALNKASPPAYPTAVSSISVSASTTPVQSSGLNPTTTTAVVFPQPSPAFQFQSSTAGVEQPSAFSQVLSQVPKSSSSTSSVVGTGLFGLASQHSTISTYTAPSLVTATNNPASSSESVSTTNPLTSGLKPNVAFTTTTPSTTSAAGTSPPCSKFKPIFGGALSGPGFKEPVSLNAANPALTVSSSSTSSVFGTSAMSNTAPSSVFSAVTNNPTGTASTGSITTATQPAAQPGVTSLFGNWSTPSTSTSSAAVQAPSAGSTFQFGSAKTMTTATPAQAAVTTTASNNNFTFGVTQSGPQAVPQKVFAFGQPAPNQNSTTTSLGSFGMASTAPTTAAATTTQSTFNFGKSSFEALATPSTFGSPAGQPKPFPFGSSTASSTPASNPAPAPFTFGATPATTATTFGTPSVPAFGGGSTGFNFGRTAPPSSAPTAVPSFGATTQTQSSSSATFTFGMGAPQPASSGPPQPAPSGFNFGAGMSAGMPQFGTPVPSNPVPQMGSFNFGAAATDRPAFGTSAPFGQSAAASPNPFGSPGTPGQGFNPAPFAGSPATPSFSIGAGSKQSGARHRLQARRQHNRKK